MYGTGYAARPACVRRGILCESGKNAEAFTELLHLACCQPSAALMHRTVVNTRRGTGIYD